MEMEHITFLQVGEEEGLKEKVTEWIRDNEDKVKEIIDIEYVQYGNQFTATITFIERG